MSRKQWLVLLGAATLAFDLALTLIDRRLTATGGPTILGLEFAGSARRVAEIEAEWGSHGRDLARLSLWLDFGFMLSYGALVALAGFATRDFARRDGWRALTVCGAIAPFLAIAAALFDAAENVSWLILLGGRGGAALPVFGTACAYAKWLLIALAIAYVVWGLACRLPQLRASSDR